MTRHSVAVMPSCTPSETTHFAHCPAAAFEYTIGCRCFGIVVVCRLAGDGCSPANQPMSCRPIGHGPVSRSAIAELPRACWSCCAGDVGLGRAAPAVYSRPPAPARRSRMGRPQPSLLLGTLPVRLRTCLSSFGPASSGTDLKTLVRGGGGVCGRRADHPPIPIFFKINKLIIN